MPSISGNRAGQRRGRRPSGAAHPTCMGTDLRPCIAQLNSFLRGELAAIESYEQALARIAPSPARETMLECQGSHRTRAERLRERIEALGGTPAASSGLWGTLAKMLEGGATALGERVAIATLEEAEDHYLRDYCADLDRLDAGSRELVEKEILPLQVRSHRALSGLKMATY